jgi:hypothetical protein
MVTRFGTLNVKSLYTATSLNTVASELEKCNLYLLAVEEVRWDKHGCQPADSYKFSVEMGMLIVTYG